MARRAVIEALTLNVPLICGQNKLRKAILSSKCWYRNVTKVRDFCSGRRNDENILSLQSAVDEDLTERPQKVNLTISDSSKAGKEVEQTTNTVFGSTVINGSTGVWLTLDQKVNAYPSVRKFTAIGTGGDDFVKSMVLAVESILQHPIPQGHVKQRVSSRGKYVSVNIGPVRVISSEQVQAVYSAMRSDDRMKFFL